MPMRTMSSPLVVTRSQVSPVARPFMPGASPTAGAPMGSKASQMPMTGMALDSVGMPVWPSAWVTMVKMRLPRTGKVNQSVWPTWLMRPHQRPLGASIRGVDCVPIASSELPVAESATLMVRVCALPADILGTEIAASVPDGVTWPSI